MIWSLSFGGIFSASVCSWDFADLMAAVVWSLSFWWSPVFYSVWRRPYFRGALGSSGDSRECCPSSPPAKKMARWWHDCVPLTANWHEKSFISWNVLSNQNIQLWMNSQSNLASWQCFPSHPPLRTGICSLTVAGKICQVQQKWAKQHPPVWRNGHRVNGSM